MSYSMEFYKKYHYWTPVLFCQIFFKFNNCFQNDLLDPLALSQFLDFVVAVDLYS